MSLTGTKPFFVLIQEEESRPTTGHTKATWREGRVEEFDTYEAALACAQNGPGKRSVGAIVKNSDVPSRRTVEWRWRNWTPREST